MESVRFRQRISTSYVANNISCSFVPECSLEGVKKSPHICSASPAIASVSFLFHVSFCSSTVGCHVSTTILFPFFFPFFASHLLSSPSFSLSLLVVTQIWDRIAGFSPPSPLRVVPCIFTARRIHSALSSLVDLRRIVPIIPSLGALSC